MKHRRIVLFGIVLVGFLALCLWIPPLELIAGLRSHLYAELKSEMWSYELFEVDQGLDVTDRFCRLFSPDGIRQMEQTVDNAGLVHINSYNGSGGIWMVQSTRWLSLRNLLIGFRGEQCQAWLVDQSGL